MDITYKSELGFLGIYITENLKWNTQVRLLSPKLGKVFHTIILLKVMSPYVIRSIYYAHFHALLRYGIIFGGGDDESNTIFKIQKRVIQIIRGASKYTSCRQIFLG
jgi:hypothetical protein